MKGLIDIHTHLLWGVDDGAASREEAAKALEAKAQELAREAEVQRAKAEAAAREAKDALAPLQDPASAAGRVASGARSGQ